MKKECLLLDVFTDTPFTGNQLAVFPEAEDLDSDKMQRLANEINYSETTFIFNSPDVHADFDIRIFTPRAELPFAGHPTLGTAYALLNYFPTHLKDKNSIRLRTKAGIISLKPSNGILWMRQNGAQFFNIYKNKKEIAQLIGLKSESISDNLPIEEVSTGNTILLIPIKNLSEIRKATGIVNNIAEFAANTNSLAPYLFTFETENINSKIHTRLFAPHLGIIEDPATGSAAGPLTAYLLKYKVFGDTFEIQNEQGLEMGRPSQIMMRGNIEDETYKIEIGGKCQIIGTSIFST